MVDYVGDLLNWRKIPNQRVKAVSLYNLPASL